MAILDHRGMPVKMSDLTKEVATSSIELIRQPWYPSIASGLTPERLQVIIGAMNNNDIQGYLTLAEEMEERDLHYSSVLRTRKLAVSGLKVLIESPSDDAELVKISEYCQEVASNESFADLMMDQLDALGKSYSVSEIMWDRSEKQWEPRCYEHRDPRHFQFDYKTGRELRMRDEKDTLDGLVLQPYKFVVHYPRIKTGLPIRGGLARLALVAFMAKGYALKDWLAFAEVFGMPLRVGKYGVNATAAQKAELLRAVANIGTDAAAIIPDSMLIDFIQADRGSGGEKLFQGLADWLDSQVSKGVLGQTMTSDNGSSLAQAKVHNEVREDIKLSDAKQLAATLRRDVIKPLVDLNFGPRKLREYPMLRLIVEEDEDLESLAKSLPPFINLGLRVQESVIRDKFGLPEPEEGAEILKAPAKASVNGDSNNPEPGEDPDNPSAVTKNKRAATKETPEDEERKEKAEARRALLRKVLAGEQLTHDQRLFLASSDAGERADAIDDLVPAELKDWQKQMDPLLEPILALANRVSSYEELLEELDGIELSPEELLQVVAKLTFEARGLGDGTDKV